MTQQTSPFIEGKFGWALGESNWNLGMDENLLKFSYLFDRNIDGIVASLPSPVNGEAYFNTTDNRIYFAVNGVFSSTPVPTWFTVTLRSTGVPYQFNGTTLTTDVVNLVEDKIPAQVGSFTDLRALNKVSGPKFAALVGVGIYYLDSSDTTSVDDGGMTIVATDGGRWKLLNDTLITNITYKEYGAIINKFGDRVFVGGASLHNGTNVAAQPDWLTTFLLSPSVGRSFAFQQTAQFAALNDSGGNAGNTSVFGAQTQHFASPGNAIAVIGVAVNNNTTQSYAGAYACYLEGYQMPDARGPCYGMELDVMNFRSSVTTDPYSQDPHQVNGIQLAAGGEDANIPAQVASTNGINFWNNGQVFNCGINFGFNSIAGADGVSGTGVAIAFGKGHMMQWYGSAGVKTSSIVCTGTSTAASVRQEFVNNQVRFKNSADVNIFQVLSTANGVNFLQVASSATTFPVQLSVAGADTDRGIQIIPSGAEYVWFGNYTAGVVAQAGYITIKDQGGTIRRLLVG